MSGLIWIQLFDTLMVLQQELVLKLYKITHKAKS